MSGYLLSLHRPLNSLHLFERAENISPDLPQKLADDFKSLISDRVLPLDIILKVIVLAQGALWKHRMFRTSSANGHKKGSSAMSSAAVESSIAAHLLLLHRVLLEVGIAQIAEAPPEDAGDHDLAQRITAAFRRTLPALRMAGKWVRANLRYIAQTTQQDGTGSKPKGRDGRRNNDRRSSSTSTTSTPFPGLPEFWSAYAQFSTALRRAFPPKELPVLDITLEEDVDLAGFLPLKKFVPGEVVGGSSSKDGSKTSQGGSTDKAHNVPAEQVHPNVEQLMRIADLIVDAEALAEDAVSSLPTDFKDSCSSDF